MRKVGGIDIPTIQKHLNQWFSLSLDLHGSEVSSNAASYFANGLKGRAKEDTFDEHVVQERRTTTWSSSRTGKPVTKEVLMRNAMNEVLRDWYVGDCAAGVDPLEPDPRGARHVGPAAAAGSQVPPRHRHVFGLPLRSERRAAERGAVGEAEVRVAPSAADTEYLLSIMDEPVFEPGKFANYIAPPRRGINQQPIDFEYVRTEAVEIENLRIEN